MGQLHTWEGIRMGWRFRRSIGVKGFRLNISKTGLSTSIGVPGATYNHDLSGRRKKAGMFTFGLPGTGISYRTSGVGPERGTPADTAGKWVIALVGFVILVIVYVGANGHV